MTQELRATWPVVERYSRSIGNWQPKSTYILRTASGDSTPAIGIGKVQIRLANGQQTSIEDVYHVPGLRANLLLVVQLADRGVEVRLQPNCVLLVKDGKTIATGARCGRRYILTAAAKHVALAAKTRPRSEPFDLWHRRFGHIGQDRLRQLHAVTVGLISSIGQPIDDSKCAVCLHAKQAKVVNRVAPERATKTLERVYTDFCGPIEPTIDKEVYILTFVDEFSRKAWVYPVKKKTDLYSTFANWKTYVELQSDNRLVALRADNASEYRMLEALLAKDGVAVEFTVAYTPEQNGVAERLNRTIFTLVWALLKQAELPNPFWGLAAKAATYIRNRAPAAEHKKTPEGVWSGKELYIGHMRVFGCLAYILNTHPMNKLSSRSIQGVFVGYSRSTRQYVVLNPIGPRFYKSSNVKFDEMKLGFNVAVRQINSRYSDNSDVGAGALIDEESSIAPIVQDQAASSSSAPGNTSTSPSRPNLAAEDNSQHTEVPGASEVVGAIEPAPVEAAELAPIEAEDLPAAPEDQIRKSNQARRPVQRYEALITAGSSPIVKPGSYREAINDPIYSKQWKNAIQDELQSLEARSTWRLLSTTDLPAGQNVIGCRWVFKVKYSPNGQIDRFKATLVAQGFSQQYGVDYPIVPSVKGGARRLLSRGLSDRAGHDGRLVRREGNDWWQQSKGDLASYMIGFTPSIGTDRRTHHRSTCAPSSTSLVRSPKIRKGPTKDHHIGKDVEDPGRQN